MSSYLVFSNLRANLSLEELNEILEQTGPSDRTDVELIHEATSSVAMIRVPWQTSIATSVAQKLNGTVHKGHKITVHATSEFSE